MTETRVEPKLTDEQLAALQYDKHIALTANAGSGKTFVFAKRFVKIALEENPDLDKMIAITFTEKAAGELYARVVKEINARIAKGENVRKLSKIRKKLVSAKISTIHSFCLSLLRDYSPQAGLDANMKPMEPAERTALINKVFDDAYEEELLSGQLRALLRFFGSKNLLRQAVRTAIDKRRFVDKLFREHYSKGYEATLEFLKNNTDKFFAKFVEPLINDALGFIATVNETVESVKPTSISAETKSLILSAERETDVFEKLKKLKEIADIVETKGGTLRIKDYIKPLENKEELKKLYAEKFGFVKDFDFASPYENLDKLAEISLDFFGFYSKIAEKFSESKYENGYIDFEDILLKAYELLQDEETLADLREKYRYIMVDEYQDTNELQYEIIMPILDKLNRGNLFVVGDEKQSIYMFNNAELEVFDETKSDVEQHKGEILELPHSFRLKPNNALFVNALFGKLFANPDKRYNEVGFNPLIVSSTAGEGGRVEILLTSEKEDAPAEAEMVAKKIKRLLAEKETAPGETAVLTRKNKSLSELEKAFAKEKIPYVVLGGVGYFQELVIRDIQNYLMFLSSVNNDLALVSVLRAPFYSFSDVDLFKISLEKGESFWEKLRAFAELREDVRPAVKMLETHLNYAKAFEIPLLLNKILVDTDYWAVLAAKENAEQEIANAKKLVAFSLETLRGEAVSLYEFAVKLNDAIKEIKDEGAAQTSEEDNAVKIMTYHKSKGLEFDTVFLYKTNETQQKFSVKAREFSFDKDFGLLTKTPSAQGYFYDYEHNPLAWIYQYYIRRKDSAEMKRLFYVGTTRARKNLFISATLTKKGEAREGSFFDMLQKSFGFSTEEDAITIEENLAFDSTANARRVRYEVKIEKEIAEPVDFTAEVRNSARDYAINIARIEDSEENEFVSATKIALYKFCPFKYKLTYELGYGKLFNLLKGSADDEFNARENADENVPANVLGSVLHKVLELEATPETLDEKLDEATVALVKLGENITEIKKRAKEILAKFMQSEIFAQLKSASDFRNEYEVYLKNEDYYLYGIIDKLIFEDGKIVVVDYKSDKVRDGNFDEKFSRYENQLKFYLYILSELYPETKFFEARLVFLNYPENSVTKNYDAEEISAFGEEIKKLVRKIRTKEFPKNEENCAKCVYSENGKCSV